jgi:hypothetical protein
VLKLREQRNVCHGDSDFPSASVFAPPVFLSYIDLSRRSFRKSGVNGDLANYSARYPLAVVWITDEDRVTHIQLVSIG